MGISIANLDLNLQDQLANLGQYVEIFPLFGRKKRLKLNFRFYEINLSQVSCLSVDSKEIHLPGVKGHDSKFSLRLIDNSHYLMESLSGEPFELNGSLVFKSFINKSDTVYIGYNKLKFIRPESHFNYMNEQINFKFEDLRHMSLLIEGETGSGKTRLARKVHEMSGVTGDFVHLNISALNQNLVESELFGYVKGAFTGANFDKDGAIKQANRGTLFLDEIDSLSLEMQVKLLLFLDGLTYRPVGATKEEKGDLQLIFASGQSLVSLVSRGDFRKDFYYRISSGFQMFLPSLRENKALISIFLEEFEKDKEVILCDKLKKFLTKQKWPGNYRQLKGHLTRKLYTSKSKFLKISEDDLNMINLEVGSLCKSESMSLKRIKCDYIRRTYFKFNEDTTLTANVLGISYNTVKRTVENTAC